MFPDAPHLEAIHRALWTDRESGRATVLVGAGMSRNARPVRPGRAVMPTWVELVLALIDRLYPPGTGNDRRRADLRAEAWETSTALRVAEEYTAAFGRSALDDAVALHTPDAEFLPGPLHVRLLDLPWADVLTTNYDTLLERATAHVASRRSSVVRTPAEIPATVRPRIVKLSGNPGIGRCGSRGRLFVTGGFPPPVPKCRSDAVRLTGNEPTGPRRPSATGCAMHVSPQVDWRLQV